MFSNRVPRDAGPSRWARALAAARAAGVALIDLADADPIRAGLLDGEPAPALDGAPDGTAPDPRGLAAAREAVAAYHGERGAAVDPAHVVLTTGTSESCAHLFRLLADPGGRVAAPRPGYPLFEPIARAEGIGVAFYGLERDARRWRLDLDSVDAALARGAAAVLVVQPNPPAGSCLDVAEAAALEERAAARGAAIVVDEVFGDHGWDAARPVLPALPGGSALRFTLGGLSKACGRPDLKLGWIVASGPPALRDRALAGLEWLADLFLPVGAPVQRALPALLAGRHGFLRRARERVAANLARLRAHVAAHPELELLPGAGGWCAALRTPERAGEEDLALRLLARGVVLHPGHFYDLEPGAHLVVGLLTDPGPFAEALGILSAVLAER